MLFAPGAPMHLLQFFFINLIYNIIVYNIIVLTDLAVCTMVVHCDCVIPNKKKIGYRPRYSISKYLLEIPTRDPE